MWEKIFKPITTAFWGHGSKWYWPDLKCNLLKKYELTAFCGLAEEAEADELGPMFEGWILFANVSFWSLQLVSWIGAKGLTTKLNEADVQSTSSLHHPKHS